MNPATTNQKNMANGQSLNFGFSTLKLSSKFCDGVGFHSNQNLAGAPYLGEHDKSHPVVAGIEDGLEVGNWVVDNHSFSVAMEVS